MSLCSEVAVVICKITTHLENLNRSANGTLYIILMFRTQCVCSLSEEQRFVKNILGAFATNLVAIPNIT